MKPTGSDGRRKVRLCQAPDVTREQAKATALAITVANAERALLLRQPILSPVRTWPTTGGIYFVRALDLIKIGFTQNVRTRLMRFQTGCPVPLELLAVGPGDAKEEAFLHRRFSAHRSIGEWFAMAPEIISTIAELREASHV